MARGDRGVMRLALLAAMAAMFVASLAIPEAFDDLPGGLNGPLVLVACYAIVRLLHIAVYLAAAGSDLARRRLGGSLRPALQRTAQPHRHSGAGGVGGGYREHAFGRLAGRQRAHAGRDVFTYLHLAIVGGIIIGALGIEQAVAHLEDGHFGTLGAWTLCGGLAVSVATMAVAARRLGGRWSAWRLGLAAGLLARAPLLPDAQPWLALAIVAAALIGTAVATHNAAG